MLRPYWLSRGLRSKPGPHFKVAALGHIPIPLMSFPGTAPDEIDIARKHLLSATAPKQTVRLLLSGALRKYSRPSPAVHVPPPRRPLTTFVRQERSAPLVRHFSLQRFPITPRYPRLPILGLFRFDVVVCFSSGVFMNEQVWPIPRGLRGPSSLRICACAGDRDAVDPIWRYLLLWKINTDRLVHFRRH